MQRSLTRLRLIYYTPGLITLIGLLVLVSHHLSSTVVNSRQYAIELTCSDKPKACCLGAEPYTGEYIQFDLTGSPSQDKIVFVQSAKLLRDIFSKKDTTRIVHYAIRDSATYGTLVSLLNFFLKENFNNYLVDYNYGIWVGVNIPDICERPLPGQR